MSLLHVKGKMVRFVSMNKLKFWFQKLREPVKYSASNPTNFEEAWSFSATGIQLISVIILFVIIIGVVFSLLIMRSPFSSYVSKNDVSIERKKLEDQYRQISKLNKKVKDQEMYISSVKRILSGELILDSLDEDVPEISTIIPSDIETEPTENEKVLSNKVKDDLRTNVKKKKDSNVQYFVEPVKGIVSQKFDLQSHPGVDIVTSKDKNVIACLSGTVIYSGYTQKDGFVMIIDHANGYISVYKHNKTILKKAGSKVQMSDPIAIVGNSGENTTGPHLHFELWYNQSVVNPEDYMRFTK
jgi:murein DD-endopeptidase MepM/ murein hydrolase activator NlpD